MKEFEPFQFDSRQCEIELERFHDLLTSRSSLGERKDVLPFFQRSSHLAAFVGTYTAKVAIPDLLAFEFSIFGDFACDLAVGHAARSAFCFVEFEGAQATSIFSTRRNRSTPFWSRSFEQGYSQLIDWFCLMSDQANTGRFNQLFGTAIPDYVGMSVIGRSTDLDQRGRDRLRWRENHVIVNSKKIYCITYDDLYTGLRDRFDGYRAAIDQFR